MKDQRDRVVDLGAAAERHGVPLSDDPSVIAALARLDFAERIPSELFGVVAEVLGFVYELDAESVPSDTEAARRRRSSVR